MHVLQALNLSCFSRLLNITWENPHTAFSIFLSWPFLCFSLYSILKTCAALCINLQLCCTFFNLLFIILSNIRAYNVWHKVGTKEMLVECNLYLFVSILTLFKALSDLKLLSDLLEPVAVVSFQSFPYLLLGFYITYVSDRRNFLSALKKCFKLKPLDNWRNY